jgi:tetraacyldisaccharide 4'-kinase
MAFSGIAQGLPRWWYRRPLALALLPLLPFSWLFLLLGSLRRLLYRCGALRSHRLPVPVIVVGNLTVGGSGKTPLVLWLVEHLRAQGWRPGVISRGYGGTAEGVRSVLPTSASAEVGDEPLLLARRSRVPVFVGRDRVAAGQALLAEHPQCDVIVSDDGLQHYRLQRSVELVVFDGRGAGNGLVLPAGPLREPLRRLGAVMAVVWNGAPEATAAQAARALPQFDMLLAGERFVALADPQQTCVAATLRGQRLYAIAGIGDPGRFFRQLEALGLAFEAHPFSDHHCYSAADLAFAQDGVLLMTEKDAVKCAALALGEAWVLPVAANVLPRPGQSPGNTGLLETILEKLDGRTFA